jgi:phosphoadenosine phosphosulfate reductase
MPRDGLSPGAAGGGPLADLNARFADDPAGALAYAVGGGLGRVAVVSSFGAESAVLLHMVAELDRTLPVLFIDTRMLFPETLAYQARLQRHLGLIDVRHLQPGRVDLFLHDPDAVLHGADPDACCDLRKTRVLARALSGFDAWISGRKRFQNGIRAAMQMFESDPDTGRVRINPLAGFSATDLRAHMDRHNLPRHPLVARGYPSIGCAPCTTPAARGEDPRAGRWRGRDKTECGLHPGPGAPGRGDRP